MTPDEKKLLRRLRRALRRDRKLRAQGEAPHVAGDGVKTWEVSE